MEIKINPDLKAVAMNMGSKVGYLFCDPDLIKQVHHNHEYFDKLNLNPGVLYLLSGSLIFSHGKSWQRQRHFLGQFFHFDWIKNQLPIVKSTTSYVFSELYQQVQNQPQIEVQVVKTCEKVSSGVVQQTFFGQMQERLKMKKPDGTIVSMISELVDIIRESALLTQQSKFSVIKTMFFKQKSLSILATKREKQILQRLTDLTEACKDIINARKQQLLEDPSKYKFNFLDLYLKEMIINQNNEITDQEVIDNFMGLFFAGTDTTSNMTGMAQYFLSLHPEIQQQAREEVVKILSSKSKTKNPTEMFESITFDDLSNMNLIHSILKETLRMNTPAPNGLFRYAVSDIKIGDFQVKKGDIVNTLFLYNQLNPSSFSNPDVFDPYRWMDSKLSATLEMTPFSIGHRNCIGQHLAIIESKCMLTYILLHFEIIRNHSQQLKQLQKQIYGPFPCNLVFFKKLTKI